MDQDDESLFSMSQFQMNTSNNSRIPKKNIAIGIAVGILVLFVLGREFLVGLLTLVAGVSGLIVLPISFLGGVIGKLPTVMDRSPSLGTKSFRVAGVSFGLMVGCMLLGGVLTPKATTDNQGSDTNSSTATTESTPKSMSGEEYYKAAMEAGQKRQFADALGYLRAIDAGDPVYTKAQVKVVDYERLEKVSKLAASNQRLKSAMAFASGRQFDEAISALEAFEQDDPNYEKAQAKISQYRSMAEEASRAAERAELNREIQAATESGIRLKSIAKSPDRFVGDYVAWRGQIMQISEEDGNTFAQVSYYESGITGDNFFVKLEGTIDVVGDDYVVVYGKFDHMQSYTSQANYELNSPYVEAFSIKKIAPLSPF